MRGVDVAAGPNVLIVEDEARYGAALKDLLAASGDFGAVELAETCAQAKRAFFDAPPTMVIVDLDLPDGRGEQLIELFSEARPECKVLINSKLNDGKRIFRALQVGAAGFIFKDDESADLIMALRRVMAGETPISPQIATVILQQIQGVKAIHSKRRVELSARELGIIRLVSKGYTSAEAADILSLKYNTVSSYIKNIYRKLDVNSRCEAVYEARAQGLLDDVV